MFYTMLRISILPLALITLSTQAETAREVGWEDLVPTTADFDDPFEKLTEDQLYELGLVVRTRERKARGATDISEETLAAAAEAEEKLRADKVDIEGLLARREEITEKRRARAEAVNTELDGQNVRIPGYLLPLDFDGKKVTEFLLVPYVGACIHVPPPPPNQIVHVRPDEAVDDPGMFAAVSGDGLNWTAVPEPLTFHASDTDTSVLWDEGIERYVMYSRLMRDGRRWIGRAEADDFGHWGPVRPVVCPRM